MPYYFYFRHHISMFYKVCSPARTPGGGGVKTRIRPPYPKRVKGDYMGRFLGITVKRVAPCRCRTSTLKIPTKCLWHWEPDRRYNFFFSSPTHLCHHIYHWNIVLCYLKHQYTHIDLYGKLVKGTYTVVFPVPNIFPIPNNLNWRVSHTFKWQCWGI